MNRKTVPYDPFGLGRMVYIVKNMCLEEPEMEYEDRARIIFYYTNGIKGVPNAAKEFAPEYDPNLVFERISRQQEQEYKEQEQQKNQERVPICSCF